MAENIKTSERRPVSVIVEGIERFGGFYTEDGMVTVEYGVRDQTTQLGGHEGYPEGLVRLLLREMASASTSLHK